MDQTLGSWKLVDHHHGGYDLDFITKISKTNCEGLGGLELHDANRVTIQLCNLK